MRILVTGASGFIGSHVVRALINAGHSVLGLVTPNANLWRLNDVLDRIELLRGDLKSVSTIEDELQNWKPTTCVHLAWYAKPAEYLHSRENLYSLKGSLDLLQLLGTCGCEHFIGAGTCAEYEIKSEKLSESDNTNPETLYAASKLSFRMIGEQIAKPLKIRFAWGRIFYVYGSYEDSRRLVPSTIHNLQKGERFSSTSGEQVRDYLHVIDVANAFSTLVNCSSAGTYNICSAEPITIKELLDTIGMLMEKPELLDYGTGVSQDWAPGFVCGSNNKLKSIGWSPHINLSAGLKDTIDWWTKRLEKNDEIGD